MKIAIEDRCSEDLRVRAIALKQLIADVVCHLSDSSV